MAHAVEEGTRVVRQFLVNAGIDDQDFFLFDGSGMSRSNQATPRAITTLLRHMFFHPAGAEFAQSLHKGSRPLTPARCIRAQKPNGR